MIESHMINEKYYKRFGRLNSTKVASIKNNGYDSIDYYFPYLTCKNYLNLSQRNTIKVFKRMSKKYRYCYKLNSSNIASIIKKGDKHPTLEPNIDNMVYVFTDMYFYDAELIYDYNIQIGISKHFEDEDFYNELIYQILESMKLRKVNIAQLSQIISSFRVLPKELNGNHNYNEFYWRLLLIDTDIYELKFRNDTVDTNNKFKKSDLNITILPYKKLDFEYIQDLVVTFSDNPTKKVAEEIYYFTEEENLYEYTLRHIEELQDEQEKYYKEIDKLNAIFNLQNKFKSNPKKWEKIKTQYKMRKDSLNYSYKYDDIYNAYHIMLAKNTIKKCQKILFDDIDINYLDEQIDMENKRYAELQETADYFADMREEEKEQERLAEEERIKKQQAMNNQFKLYDRFFNLDIELINTYNINKEQEEIYRQYTLEVDKFGISDSLKLDYIDAFFELFDIPQDDLKDQIIEYIEIPF